MSEWLKLSQDDRKTVILQTAVKLNLSVEAIEKDWWITTALRALFQCDFANITLHEFSAILPFSGFSPDLVFGKDAAEPFINLPVAGFIDEKWPFPAQVNGSVITKTLNPQTAYIAAPKHIFYMLALIFEAFANRDDVSVLKFEQSAAGGGVGMPSYELEFRK